LHRLIAGARVESLRSRPLSVPLIEPFVIATGRVDATRAVEIEVTVAYRGRTATGLGEAACLPPVTREDQHDVLAALERGLSIEDLPRLGRVTRAGVETALLDAVARVEGVALRTLLGGEAGTRTRALETDVTVAIAPPEKMGELARAWAARGFRAIKVKVGKDVDEDVRALEAIARAAPQVVLRVDANAGYRAEEAIGLAKACERLGVPVECWEQPCAAEDLEGMAEVAASVSAPVVADESVQGPEDVGRIVSRRAAGAVNLKLAKLGGVEAALETGLAARRAGLKLMMGGMVETRLGMTAAAHVACALGGVEFVDLDTAWLLAEDPYVGGYAADGPHYMLPDAPGLDVSPRPL
jgi:L-alanine-DL-glutamate epimerase-like enolase superfamily enzyme